MGRTVHRRYRTGTVVPQGVGRLPVVGRVFVVLAALAALAELWAVVDAWQLGASEWWSDVPQLLPVAARAAAIVVLPAAVAWASPTRFRANPWLWRGVLLVAVAQLLRYPATLLQRALVDAYGGGDADTTLFLAQAAIGLALGFLSVLAVWALSEGVKDAGGRSRGAVAFAAVVGIAGFLLLVVPGLAAGVTVDLQLAVNVLSVGLNGLFLFASALLAARLLAGVLRRVPPAVAWRVGAIGGWVVLVLPSLSLASLLVSVYVLPPGEGVSIPYLGVATYFGWPLIALALGMGMARLRAATPDPAGSGFVLRGTPRLVAAAG
jgi:hypothetical protein